MLDAKPEDLDPDRPAKKPKKTKGQNKKARLMTSKAKTVKLCQANSFFILEGDGNEKQSSHLIIFYSGVSCEFWQQIQSGEACQLLCFGSRVAWGSSLDPITLTRVTTGVGEAPHYCFCTA